MKSSVFIVWGCPFALTSGYVSELFEALTHLVILIKIIFVLKSRNLFFVDSKPPPLLKSSMPFYMCPSLPPHTHFSSSLLSLSVFSPIPPFQFVFHDSFLPLPLASSSINVHFLSYLCPPGSFLSYVLISSLFSVVSPYQTSSLFSFLFTQTFWVISILSLPDHLQ